MAMVEAIDEQADRTVEGIRAARETARLASQARQVMTQLGIVGFNRVGIGLAFGDFIATEMEPE